MNELPRLNQSIWRRHRSRSAQSIRADFERGYQRILTIARALSSEQLLAPGYFAWTGTHPLTTHLGPNAASHYRFAQKVLKRWSNGPRSSHAIPGGDFHLGRPAVIRHGADRSCGDD